MMKTYILGIQKGFCLLWGDEVKVLSGPICNCPVEVFFAVVDNKARAMQREGLRMVNQNFLYTEDLLHLYRSSSLSKSTPKCFQTRLVFTFGV